MIAEILEAVWHEVSHNPWHLVIELVQFAILVFIIKAVGFGIGKYRGIVPGMLDRRQERIAQELESARVRESEAAAAPAKAESIIAAAEVERDTILAGAKREAGRERERIDSETTEEGAALMRQAEETLEHEREEVLSGVRDSLLDVVTKATRQVLDEGFSPSKQKAMIQDAILASVDELESVSLD